MRQSIAVADRSGAFVCREDAVLPLYSVTKTYIAACVVAAAIDPEERISSWIDRSLVPRAADISVRQLLNHTSGLRDYGALPEYQAAIESGDMWADDQFADLTLRRALLFEPGEGWSYSNPGYWLLARIVEQDCGLSFPDFVRKFVTEPLGLRDTRVASGIFADDLPHYPAGWVWHGLLLATASDVVAFMASDLVEPLLGALHPVNVGHANWQNAAYGYGVMVDTGIRHGHTGGGPGYSASCFHFVQAGLTGCVLCSSETDDAADARLLSLVREMQGN